MAQNKQPRQFYTARELQQALGFSERATLYRLRRNGWMIDPDIKVGGRYGWDPDEVLQYGIETDRLRPDGTPTGRRAAPGRPSRTAGGKDTRSPEFTDTERETPRPGVKPSEPPRRWRKKPTRYLSASEIPELVGMDQVTLWKLRHLVPIPAAVQLGSHYGYTRKAVLRWFDEVTRDARRMDVSPVTLHRMRLEDQQRRKAS